MSSTQPVPSTPQANAPLRIVLFGMPDAGKSSLLGALAQSAQMQERQLRGRLVDLTHGLAELKRRLYDDRQTETREEIVPYPVVYEPYPDTLDSQSRLDAVIYDCDGRVANELLSQKKRLIAGAKAGALASSVLNADALVLVVDASATSEQVETDFREFVRFLKLLESHRTHDRSVGGLPIFLVLSKCDLLARKTISRAEWESKIDARRQQVQERFAKYLAVNANTAVSLLAFGSIELHLAATAVKRPALEESAAHPREPYGIAELFRDSLESAYRFRRRITSANRRLKWTIAGIGGFMLVAAVLALFLLATGGPVEQPFALIDRIEMLQAREKPLPERLDYNVLQSRYDELRLLRDDSAFVNLPEDKKNFVRSRLDELLAYQEFIERLTRIPFPERARTLGDLTRIENDLNVQAAPPSPYQNDWERTQAVLERKRRLEEVRLLRTAVEDLRVFYTQLKAQADNLLFDKSLHALWKPRVDAVFDMEKNAPLARDEPVRGAAYEFDLIERGVGREWEKTRFKLETLRDAAQALGLIGKPADAILEFREIAPDEDIARLATQRMARLRHSCPNYKRWPQAALPEPLRKVIQEKAVMSLQQLNQFGQQTTKKRLFQGRPAREDTPRDWQEMSDWLTSPALNDTRELFTLLAQLNESTAEDPVAAAAAFMRKSSFEIEIKSLTLTMPNNLPQGPFIPGEELIVYLRPQGGTAVRHTLTLRIDRAATVENVLDKQYVYKLTSDSGKLSYKPRDEFGAELNLKKGDRIWQLMWTTARTSSFAFESLVREPVLLATGSMERGTLAQGVKLKVEGTFPPIPDLLPDLRSEKK